MCKKNQSYGIFVNLFHFALFWHFYWSFACLIYILVGGRCLFLGLWGLFFSAGISRSPKLSFPWPSPFIYPHWGLFFFFFKREKKNNVGWIRRWKGSGNWERGINMMKIYCVKKLFSIKNRLLENDKLLEASYTNNTENFGRFSSC